MAMDGDLIALVNKLQDTFNAIGGDAVDLPQIVVVGSQSAGKSSVLETIVGRDFLPRGSGIVTRRPLILQLIHTPNGGGGGMASGEATLNPSTGTEYAEFLHLNRRFTDFEEIRREIENETFRVAGQNKGVSKLPINLKIYGPGVLNLTLVDLPGLTKVPVGDQPTDIERQIRNLVMDYISKPNSVILAVSPANVDIANSDSLKLARSVDPRGLRTIGVLTKLDLMDAGTNALDILTGRTYPLKLGFIGVVNRSQQDINVKLPMEEALRNEEEYFKQHSVYRNLAHRCGTKYLAKTLNHVLMNHIRDKLPDMKARLNTLMGQTQQELNAFGDATFLGEQHRGSLILKLMTEFARDFVSSIDGTSLEISTKELCGGARIYYIFNDVFGQALESINPTHNLTTQDIRTAIRNSTGPRPSLFVPEVAFDLLVKPQIKLLEQPSLRCVELVYEELMKICHNCTSPELQRFPRLHAQLIEVISELLRERLGPTSDYASSLISIQAAYINTNHPEFVAGTATFAREGQQSNAPVTNKKAPSSVSSPDGEDSDEEQEEGDESMPMNSNGNEKGARFSGQAGNKSRTASTSHPSGNGSESRHRNSSSIQQPAAPTPRHFSDSRGGGGPPGGGGGNGRDGDRHRPTSASGILSGQHQMSIGGMSGTSPHTAKETFLNYFFGGPGGDGGSSSSNNHNNNNGGGGGGNSRSNGSNNPSISMGSNAMNLQYGSGSGSGSNMSGVVTRGGDGGRGARDLLPDLGTRRGHTGGQGSSGGLEERSVAYDMRSLGKHLEAAPEQQMHLTPREEMETSLIRSLIASYFNITRQTIQDLVPKAIMHLLVNYSRESVQQRLVTSLYKPELFEELLFEDEALVTERTRIKSLLDAYKEAFRVLSEVSLKST